MERTSSILIDNNTLSDPLFPQRVAGKTIYLADGVFGELFGKGNWTKSIQTRSSLAPFADNVVSTVNLAIPLRAELQTGQPTISIVGDARVNQWLPSILRGCRDDPERVRAYFSGTQLHAPKERANRMSQIENERLVATDVRARIQSRLTTSELGRLRNAPESIPAFFEAVDIWPSAIVGMIQLAQNAEFPCPLWEPEKMTTTACCWMRLLLADLCLGIRRAVKRNFESVTDDELHGDHIDREIIILSTYADEFFSNDRGAYWLDKALRACVREMFAR
jgi:hypothetical protein